MNMRKVRPFQFVQQIPDKQQICAEAWTKVINLTTLSLVKLFSIPSSMDYDLALFLSKGVKLNVCKNKSQGMLCASKVASIQSEFLSAHSNYQLLTTSV